MVTYNFHCSWWSVLNAHKLTQSYKYCTHLQTAELLNNSPYGFSRSCSAGLRLHRVLILLMARTGKTRNTQLCKYWTYSHTAQVLISLPDCSSSCSLSGLRRLRAERTERRLRSGRRSDLNWTGLGWRKHEYYSTKFLIKIGWMSMINLFIIPRTYGIDSLQISHSLSHTHIQSFKLPNIILPAVLFRPNAVRTVLIT